MSTIGKSMRNGMHKPGSALFTLFLSACLVVALGTARAQETAAAAFQPEPLGNVLTLPTPYPSHWILALDSSFFHMMEGQVVVLDPLAETVSEQYKGMYTASFMAATARSRKRNEHYVAETFYSRHGRGGERTDLIAIYDPSTLSVIAEVGIPPKRLGGIPKRIAMQLTNDENFALVYNFTPAQSVSVVDLEKRTFAGEIDIPGCAFVIATGDRGFTSICANGALLTVRLNKDGSVRETKRSEPVISVDDDPVFEAYGQVGETGYFPTFTGNVLPIKLSGKVAEPQASWSLVSDEERSAGWRPGGGIPVIADATGELYVLMHPDGKDGTHKNGGGEVWVYNVKSKQRVRKIELKNWGISLAMTGGEGRQIMTVVNADLGVDVYDAKSGSYLNSIAASMSTPFLIEGVN